MGYDQVQRKLAKTMMSSKKALHDILTETLDVSTSSKKGFIRNLSAQRKQIKNLPQSLIKTIQRICTSFPKQVHT